VAEPETSPILPLKKGRHTGKNITNIEYEIYHAQVGLVTNFFIPVHSKWKFLKAVTMTSPSG